MEIETDITRLLKIRTPVVAAPMAGASTGALAAHVSLAGGFGFMAAGYDTRTTFLRELEIARTALTTTSTASSADKADRLPIGVGFLGWVFDDDPQSLQLLTDCLDARVAAVWFSFGKDLGRWVRKAREYDALVNPSAQTQHPLRVFVLVNTVEEARLAVADMQPDVLVAQGNESGGHGLGSAPPLFELLPSILDELSHSPPSPPSHGPPADNNSPRPLVLAAGGLSTGAHAAAMLTLGAAGVVLGTRFLLTPESRYTPAQKQALLSAHAGSTVRTMAFDLARGTLGWPEGIDGRGLRNQTVRNVEKGMDIEDVRGRYQAAVRDGDAEGMVVWAGTGIGLVNKIMPAGEVVAELHKEIISRIKISQFLINTTMTNM